MNKFYLIKNLQNQDSIMNNNSDSDSNFQMETPCKRRCYVDVFDSSEAGDFLPKKQFSTPTLH